MNNPAYFHLHHQAAHEDLEFWKNLARENGDPILELGCGTGRVMLPLIVAGHEVIGLDINFQALHYLIDHATGRVQDKIKIFQADVSQMEIAENFSLVIMACNMLSTLPEVKRIKVFSKVKDLLLRDGVFAASLPNPEYLAALPDVGEPEVEGSFQHPETNNPVQISSEWRRSNRSIMIKWNYDHLFPDGRVERETVEIEQHLTQLEEYLAELGAAGLDPREICGDFDRSGYNVDSPYLILVAGKGAEF